MFRKSQHWYDLVYEAQGKNYVEEARTLERIFAGRGISADVLGRRPRWLDVACGTAHHLSHLPDFERVGTDLDPGMLELARERCPNVVFVEADMRHSAIHEGREHRVPSSFDVVTCLFSAIAYMPDEAALGEAVRAMAGHLAPGGLLLVEPFLAPTDVRPNRPWMTVVDRPEIKIARMDVPQVVGRVLHLEFQYLVSTAEGVLHEIERHEIGLFTVEEIGVAFEKAGLEWAFDETGLDPRRGLHLGRRPLA